MEGFDVDNDDGEEKLPKAFVKAGQTKNTGARDCRSCVQASKSFAASLCKR